MTVKACPICSSAAAKTFKAKVCLTSASEYDLVQCPACSAMYFSPMPEVPEIVAFYDYAFWGAEADRQTGKGAAFARLYLPSARRQAQDRVPRFLDVGCSSGFFLKGVSTHTDWDCHGIEINAELAKFAAEDLKLKVAAGTLEDAHFAEQSFDYIHLRDIVEHVTDPLQFLSLVRKYIRPDGQVYLSIPNGAIDVIGIVDFFRLSGRKSRSPNGHLYFLDTTALRKLLDRAGFEIETGATYGIKQALRAREIIPRKKKFMRQFDTLNYTGAEEKIDFVPDASKPRSLAYHVFKMLTSRLLMLRWLSVFGLRASGFGLDFELVLRPKKGVSA